MVSGVRQRLVGAAHALFASPRRPMPAPQRRQQAERGRRHGGRLAADAGWNTNQRIKSAASLRARASLSRQRRQSQDGRA